MKLGLVLRTLPYLRWEQLIYRPTRLLQFRLYRYLPKIAARWTDGFVLSDPSLCSLKIVHAVFTALPHLNPPFETFKSRLDDLAIDRFTFLNRTLTLKPLDWNHRYENHLWNYRLHYFDYAVWCARAFTERGDKRAYEQIRQLVDSWITKARIGISDGWDAYPVSLRLVNWIYAYALVAERVNNDDAFLKRWAASIYRQLDFLSRHIEYHLLANHLVKNAKAMVIGGLFFETEKWLAQGEQLLWRELDEQMLADGGHYERAPMYHALALADFLECFALLKAARKLTKAQIQHVESQLHAMANFLSAMSYSDGTLALFNDSANTEEARPRPILDSVESVLGSRRADFSITFPQSGYYLWSSRRGDERIIVDAGPPSVDYNTAHAHCDLLSYELWLLNCPFIVDSGIHGYGGDPFREYSRSTRAHNTVVFDGREQSEIWGTFRIARRARVLFAATNGEEEHWSFRGAYKPYHRSFTHERRISRLAQGNWVIEDLVNNLIGQVNCAESFIHLYPGITAHQIRDDDFAIECRVAGQRVIIEPFGANGVEVLTGVESPTQGWYFSDFGVAQPSSTIRFDYSVKIGEAFGYQIKVASV